MPAPIRSLYTVVYQVAVSCSGGSCLFCVCFGLQLMWFWLVVDEHCLGFSLLVFVSISDILKVLKPVLYSLKLGPSLVIFEDFKP